MEDQKREETVGDRAFFWLMCLLSLVLTTLVLCVVYILITEPIIG